MKKPFLFTVFCLLTAAPAYAGQIQISTYYPSPFGYYERLKFNPRLALTEPCEPGTVYYLSGTGLKYCAEDTTWKNMGGSVWTQNVNDIYPIDTTTNPNLTVGIGTTSPDEELHIGQAMGNVVLRLGDFGPNDWDLIRSVGVDIPSGSFALKMFGAANPSLVADTLGNIGIGTMTPLAKLNVTASDQALVMFNNPGTGFNQATIQLISDAANMIMRATSTADAGGDHKVISAEADNSTEFRLWTNWDYTTSIGTPITFFTKGFERMRIDGETGNVGIGTTSPTSRLHVYAPEGYSPAGVFLDTADMDVNGGPDGQFRLRNNSVSGTQKIFIGGSAGDVLTVDTVASRVGIGTTTPGIKLSVYDTTTGSKPLLSLAAPSLANNEAVGIWLGRTGSTDESAYILYEHNTTTAERNLQFGHIGAAPKMVIKNSGDIGIGTSAPGARLDVQGGAIKATGGFILETRTTNPGSPAAGQMWVCTDTGDATPCNGI